MMENKMRTLREQLSDQRGYINPIAFTYVFHISMPTLMASLNIPTCGYEEQDDLYIKNMQRCLSELVDILSGLHPLCGSYLETYEWYKTHCITGFGGLTAYDLVKGGRADAVLHYIEQIKQGGYA